VRLRDEECAGRAGHVVHDSVAVAIRPVTDLGCRRAWRTCPEKADATIAFPGMISEVGISPWLLIAGTKVQTVSAPAT
jgi:hypothetical protein